jgi:hypothetical protein
VNEAGVEEACGNNIFVAGRDPLRLWEVIRATHLAAITGDVDKDRNDALRAYMNLTQGKTQDILAYKTVFMSSLAS